MLLKLINSYMDDFSIRKNTSFNLLILCLFVYNFSICARNPTKNQNEINKTYFDYGGPYLLDGIKKINGNFYSVLNNFVIGQNALVKFNKSLDTCEILGHILKPYSSKYTEGAFNILPDNTFQIILRKETGDLNYMSSTSTDGKNWSDAKYLQNITSGTSSKPFFEKINGIYYLGWQDKHTIEGKARSIFNIDVSKDGKCWVRKYQFQTKYSFQYPVIREYDGKIYISATSGRGDSSGKERIVFGLLEIIDKKIPENNKIITKSWNPILEANKILEGLITVTPDFVKGAHDVDMVLNGDKAYLVYEANEIKPGENPLWSEVYSALSTVDLKKNKIDYFMKIATSEEVFENSTLQKGAVFVPRIALKNINELRFYFTSEDPDKRQSQMWYIDYNLKKHKLSNKIYKVKMKTPEGIFDMNAGNFYNAALHSVELLNNAD